MVSKLTLNDKPSVIKIVIETKFKEKIWIQVRDANRKNTYYTKRYGFVDGQETFKVLMPQHPQKRLWWCLTLPYKLPRNNFSKKTQAFVKFAQEFCDECGYLSSSPQGDVYMSNNGKYRIDYLDTIRNVNGVVLKTPARISQVNGRIEVSAEQYRGMTIPMRMAILLHEYSHFYLNRNPSNEVEADINGLNIYLKLGYPKIDIYNVFLNVFKTAPSEANKKRFDKLDKFVKNHR